MRKMKVITDAATFSAGLPNRASKNWGMVAESRCCVMILVRRPRMTHAIREPMMVLPIPAQVAAMPYFHPN